MILTIRNRKFILKDGYIVYITRHITLHMCRVIDLNDQNELDQKIQHIQKCESLLNLADFIEKRSKHLIHKLKIKNYCQEWDNKIYVCCRYMQSQSLFEIKEANLYESDLYACCNFNNQLSTYNSYDQVTEIITAEIEKIYQKQLATAQEVKTNLNELINIQNLTQQQMIKFANNISKSIRQTTALGKIVKKFNRIILKNK